MRQAPWSALAVLTVAVAAAVPFATPAAAIQCSPLPASVPGTPVAVSSLNPQYFLYNANTIPLLGESHEYICHIPQPSPRQPAYCTFENHVTVFANAAANWNNVYRLVAILNHSPGLSAPDVGYVMTDESPFLSSGGKWNLKPSAAPYYNTNYFDHLETVVCDAYNAGIIVELTLLNPWDGKWSTSPFNPANTVAPTTQGFTQRRFFARFENAGTDPTPQNSLTRQVQRDLLTTIVNKLKKYPNIIWEIANEPDFIPSNPPPGEELGGSVSPADVFAWQQQMATTLLAADTTHVVMLNGHHAGVYAWNDARFKAASAHYTTLDAPGTGAIQILRDPTLASSRAAMPLGFNENRFVPNPTPTAPRTADDVRAESWEFMMGEGGLFDGYSLNRSDPVAVAVSAQLKTLYLFVNAVTTNNTSDSQSFFNPKSVQQVSCNGASDWCRNVPAYGAQDSLLGSGCLPSGGANLYWSSLSDTMGTEYALYLHHSLQRNGFGGYQAKLCGDGVGSGYRHAGSYAIQVKVTQAGCWTEGWFNPKTGAWLASGIRALSANQWYSTAFTPVYTHDVVLHLHLWKAGSC